MATSFHLVNNNAASTLASAIDDNDLSVSVATGDGAEFDTGKQYLTIGRDTASGYAGEIVDVTSRSTDAFTIASRGADDTIATSHEAGEAVEGLLVAAHITEMQTAINGIENGTTTLAKVITSGTAVNTHTIDDATTNTVVSVLELYKTSSGTPAAGIGAKHVIGAENSNNESVAAIETHGYLSTVTDSSEQGVYLVRLMSAGSLADLIKFTTVLAGQIGTPDADVSLVVGRARLDSRTSDFVCISHYDQSTTTTYGFRQSATGATVINSVSTGTLANSGTNSLQWTNGRLVGGPALGTLNVRMIGTLSNNITTVGNVGSGEDDLMSYTVPAAQLPTDKDCLAFEMVFKTAANANNKTIKVKYGATTLFDSGAVAADNDVLVVRGRVIRTGATTQIAHISAIGNAGGAFTDTAVYTTPAETLSGTVVLKATGEATSDNDIQQVYMSVEWQPAT